MKPFKFLTNQVDEEESDPSLPSYYDIISGFRFAGVTPTKYDPDTYLPYRHLVYEHIDTGEMTMANVIDVVHPMFNYYRQINPEFYNSHYLNR